jgi:MYXO-CTERM domain-containing protein
LFVADPNNYRVLSFDAAATLPNGVSATAVLGQTTFLTATGGTSATQVANPPAVLAVASPDVLLVVDMGNARVLRFGVAAATPAPVPAASRSVTLAFAALLMVAGALHVRRRRPLAS